MLRNLPNLGIFGSTEAFLHENSVQAFEFRIVIQAFKIKTVTDAVQKLGMVIDSNVSLREKA